MGGFKDSLDQSVFGVALDSVELGREEGHWHFVAVLVVEDVQTFEDSSVELRVGFDVCGRCALAACGRVAGEAQVKFAARFAALVARVVLRSLHSNYFKRANFWEVNSNSRFFGV